MRTDYALYVVALIFFIIAAGVVVANMKKTELYIYALAVVGIAFIGLGYMARPKTTTIAVTKPSTPTPKASPEAEAQPKTVVEEEPKKEPAKKNTRRTTRRRRKA